MRRVYVDRSRVESFQRCNRKRFLEYHESGTGISPGKKNLALCVGGSVHVGLEMLLREGQAVMDNNPHLVGEEPGDFTGAATWTVSDSVEELAVSAALADFAKHSGALELDTTEQAAMVAVVETAEAVRHREEMLAQARELGMEPADFGQPRERATGEFERYLYAEQSALVEAMVRAYARRRLQPLLEEFEVLEVEREGSWGLSTWTEPTGVCHCGQEMDKHSIYDNHSALESGQTIELWFMSRPDALLRHRQSNELYLLSYKTTAGWDVRRAKSAERDMQGLSEGVEVERRLGEWWHLLKQRIMPQEGNPPGDAPSQAMFDYLSKLEAPPRIHAIRYEFLLKGERWKDKELSERLGMEVRSQRSHLIRRYVAVSVPKKGDGGYRVGDACWSWDFIRTEDDKSSTLAWQNWKSRSVWDQDGGARGWIDRMDDSQMLMSGEDSTLGMEPRVLGWKSSAQAMGVTREHPLDSVFLPPVVVYRNDDELRDWVEQVEAQERTVAEHIAEVNAAGDPSERHSRLNRYFPQHRGSCFYPGQCAFAGTVCWAANSEVESNPMSSGKFKPRVPNHPQEKENEQ